MDAKRGGHLRESGVNLCYNNKVLDEFILSVLSFPEQMRKCNVLEDPPAWWSNSWNDRYLSVQRPIDVLFLILYVPGIVSVPVAVRSKAYVCGRSPAEIVGSNPTGGMDVCLL